MLISGDVVVWDVVCVKPLAGARAKISDIAAKRGMHAAASAGTRSGAAASRGVADVVCTRLLLMESLRGFWPCK